MRKALADLFVAHADAVHGRSRRSGRPHGADTRAAPARAHAMLNERRACDGAISRHRRHDRRMRMPHGRPFARRRGLTEAACQSAPTFPQLRTFARREVGSLCATSANSRRARRNMDTPARRPSAEDRLLPLARTSLSRGARARRARRRCAERCASAGAAAAMAVVDGGGYRIATARGAGLSPSARDSGAAPGNAETARRGADLPSGPEQRGAAAYTLNLRPRSRKASSAARRWRRCCGNRRPASAPRAREAPASGLTPARARGFTGDCRQAPAPLRPAEAASTSAEDGRPPYPEPLRQIGVSARAGGRPHAALERGLVRH